MAKQYFTAVNNDDISKILSFSATTLKSVSLSMVSPNPIMNGDRHSSRSICSMSLQSPYVYAKNSIKHMV